MPLFASELPDPTTECPVFVTWEKNNSPASSSAWHLRGCIGTLSPRLLIDAVGEYAIISAIQDRRFHPVAVKELPYLRVSVSLLVQYESCEDVYDWTVGLHGILIKFVINGRSYSATYLPEVAKEQGWTTQQTVTSLIQKAGYHGSVNPDLLHRIKCTKYQSSKCKVPFAEYISEHCEGIDPLVSSIQNELSAGGKVLGQSCKQM